MTEDHIVGTSPHIRDEIIASRIMWAVVIALIPVSGMGIYFFGWNVLILILASVITAVLTDFIIQKWRGVKNSSFDGSAVVTGLLLALIVTPELPVKYIIIGSFFSITIGKQVFGGLGKNIWNPALVGRVFLQIAYTEIMNSTWVLPRGAIFTETQATPLASVQQNIASGVISADRLYQDVPDWMSLAWGNIQGCAGETSALALIVGGLFLVFLKVVDWRIPLFFVGTAVLFGWILPVKIGGEMVWFASDPLFHLFAGGLLLGGFFMATDIVTTPLTSKGKIVFACGGGILVALIRTYPGHPEGVCYSILIMNTAVPLIDKWMLPKPFGFQKRKGK